MNTCKSSTTHTRQTTWFRNFLGLSLLSSFASSICHLRQAQPSHGQGQGGPCCLVFHARPGRPCLASAASAYPLTSRANATLVASSVVFSMSFPKKKERVESSIVYTVCVSFVLCICHLRPARPSHSQSKHGSTDLLMCLLYTDMMDALRKKCQENIRILV